MDKCGDLPIGSQSDPSAPTGRWSRTRRYVGQTRRSVRDLLAGELPPDVRDEEFAVAACFQASLLLNAFTGGEPTMTFSARSHLNHTRARWFLPWMLWGLACLVIDFACAVIRGESEHCATAWANHCARGGGVNEEEPSMPPLSPSAITEI
ncbi:MAG: hypothetical protein AAF183_13845 [Pseudomonadota bacterium]